MRADLRVWIWIRRAAACGALIGVLALTQSPAGAQSENDFYRELLKKEVATNEDAIRAVARYKQYHGPADLKRELEYLHDLGIRYKRNMVSIANRPISKGEAANIFLNAMGKHADQRGLFGRFFTRSRRYAARDGMAQEILPKDSFANEFMSGAELLAMLSRAAEQTEEKE